MSAIRAQVMAEEILGTYDPPNNGTAPMWCYGSPTLVRDGRRVFASLPETGRDVPLNCNTRWQLFCRDDGGRWDRVAVSAMFDEREPCPLLRLPDGRILMSVNPLAARATSPTESGGDCIPSLLAFLAAAPREAPSLLKPVWAEAYGFCEYSYRGVAADRLTGDLLVLNITGENQAWTYMTGNSWTRQGLLRFPLRGCYPQVALRNRAAYIVAIGDIVEANPVWRAYKQKRTSRNWDYDLRQIFFTWTPDITKNEFSPILTLGTRDETAGLMRNADLWIGPDGDAHVMYVDRNIWHAFMRDKFFSGLPITVALKYVRIHKGLVIERRTLVECTEDLRQRRRPPRRPPIKALPFPTRGLAVAGAQFHATADGRLFAVYYTEGRKAGRDVTGNYLLQLAPAGAARRPIRLRLKYPLSNFFTASERAGTEPSETIDLYGEGREPNTIRYAQVKIAP